MKREEGTEGVETAGARSGERSEPGRAEAGASPSASKKRTRRHFSKADKSATLEAIEASGLTVTEYAKRHGMSPALIYGWRKRSKEAGAGVVEPSPRKSTNALAPPRRTFTADQRRQAVETYQKTGLPLKEFAKLYGASDNSLAQWVKRYEEGGPDALEDKRRGRKKGSGGGLGRLPETTREEIRSVKSHFPDFGFRKVRDFLHRFRAVKVSTGSVRNTLLAAGVPPVPTTRKRPRKKSVPRRFERATPMQLWQSDITSFMLTRHHQRVYLVVFMDDCSRYVVSFGLAGKVSLGIVRESLKRLKAGLRQRLSVLAKQDRKHVEVQLRDGVWSLDAQELARGVTGLPGAGILQAEMLREVASTKTIGVAVSPPATGEDIVAQLERAAAERGSWPLVLATDNGAAYRSQAVEGCLVMHEVVHLRNEPRTPQHNPWVEHGHGEHQEEMLLSSWTPPFDRRELATALERARRTLDHHRLRRTRGWKTADDYDVGLAPAAGVISRAVFYETACQAVARVTAGLDRARERRRAEREAILATLQSFNVITRSRGGAPTPAPNAN